MKKSSLTSSFNLVKSFPFSNVSLSMILHELQDEMKWKFLAHKDLHDLDLDIPPRFPPPPVDTYTPQPKQASWISDYNPSLFYLSLRFLF